MRVNYAKQHKTEATVAERLQELDLLWEHTEAQANEVEQLEELLHEFAYARESDLGWDDSYYIREGK